MDPRGETHSARNGGGGGDPESDTFPAATAVSGSGPSLHRTTALSLPQLQVEATSFFCGDEEAPGLRRRGTHKKRQISDSAPAAAATLTGRGRRVTGRHTDFESQHGRQRSPQSLPPPHPQPTGTLSATEWVTPHRCNGSGSPASIVAHPLFSAYDAVGVEGAEAAASKKTHTSPAASRGRCDAAWTEEEQLLGMQLPLSSVLSCLAREQRQAFNNRELLYFAPFFVIFLLYILVGDAPHSHVYLNAEALRKMTDFDGKWLSTMEEQLLMEVFRVDTEKSSTNSSGDFVPGASKRFPWLFSYYNETVNMWTTQEGRVITSDTETGSASASGSGGDADAGDHVGGEGTPVDAQVERVAQGHHNINVMRFSSIRTKRDLMRWLLGPFLENMWDCRNPDYAQPWYQFRRGSQRMVGAVRLTATRAPTDSAVKRHSLASQAAPLGASGGSSGGTSDTVAITATKVTPGWCRRHSLRRLKHLSCGEAVAVANPSGQLPSSSTSMRGVAEVNHGRSTKTTTGVKTVVGARSHPIAICTNTTNPTQPTSEPLIRLVDGDSATGEATYEINLPFPSTCHAARNALHKLATPTREENDTSCRENLCSRYTFTTSEEDRTCASFFFHPRTTELRLRYVVYGAAVNQYYLVDLRFRFAAAGSVVVPELHVHAAPALTWNYNFTSLALSITLGAVLLLYAHHIVAAYFAVFARKRRRWEQRGWGGVAGAVQRRRLGGQGWAGGRGRASHVTGLMVALQDLLRPRSLAHICTLALTTAGLVVTWWSWGETASKQNGSRPLSYAQRLTYPESLQYLCERTAPLCARLFAAATFFLFLCAVRFACGLFSGLGLVVECLVEAMGRLVPLVLLWLWLAIASAVMGMCIYGATNGERFSNFHHAFLSLLVMFIDRGKGFWADERPQSGFDPILPSVYGSLMQRETRLAGHAQSYRWAQMHAAAGEHANAFWLFFLVFVEVFLFFVLVAAVITEAFHRTLDSGPNGNKEGVGLEHHQRQTELAVRHVGRCLCCWPYITEKAARLLWSRARVTVVADIREQLQLATTLHSDITYAGLLWLLPRALQAEVGPHQLRLWWLEWAEELQAQQRARRTWERRQWLTHWDQQPTGLRGWLQRSVPDEATLESRASQLTSSLEDLPGKVTRHAEGVARR